MTEQSFDKVLKSESGNAKNIGTNLSLRESNVIYCTLIKAILAH